MTIPYRIRRLLRHLVVTVLALVFFGTVISASWLLWLNRYVVYTKDGAKFDFSLSQGTMSGELATLPIPGETVTITYSDIDELPTKKPTELGQLIGYTVSAEMLLMNTENTIAALEDVPRGSAVLLELKTMRGDFLYSTSYGRKSELLDVSKIDQVIRTLQNRGCYLIAQIPAFRDYWFFLDDESTRVSYGLPRSGGNGSLWLDSEGPNYWMNPASSGALDYLTQIITELRTMGFDEVLLYDFRFPNTEKISFKGNKDEALQNAATTLVQACCTDTFALSFVSKSLTLPEGRCRLYTEGVLVSEIPDYLAGLSLNDPVTQLVFLTDLGDTRFNQYSVLRPLDIPSD